MNSQLTIQLPAALSSEQERLILKYQARGRQSISPAEWPLVLRGFNQLQKAFLWTEIGRLTFREVYYAQVDRKFADLYITELLKLSNVAKEFPAIRAHFGQIIAMELQKAGLQSADQTHPINLLLAYCLYFWESFAAGYAFELEIYRDLTTTGIVFEAHNIRVRRSRYSSYDLKVSDLYGDIKTSLYFLKVGKNQRLPHDFYITRLYDQQGRRRILVVMLKPKAWNQINGQTVTALLEEAAQVFPSPVRVELEFGTVVVADYDVWKTKIFDFQYKGEVRDGKINY